MCCIMCDCYCILQGANSNAVFSTKIHDQANRISLRACCKPRLFSSFNSATLDRRNKVPTYIYLILYRPYFKLGNLIFFSMLFEQIILYPTWLLQPTIELQKKRSINFG